MPFTLHINSPGNKNQESLLDVPNHLVFIDEETETLRG